MRDQRHTSRVPSIVCAMLVFALSLGTLPALAEPTDTAVPAAPTDTAAPPIVPPASTPQTPAAVKEKPAPSAIDVPVDQQTQEFRDKLAEAQARLEAFKRQLDELDRELALAAEAYNLASDQLAATKERLATAQGDLQNAQQAYDIQDELLSKRANDIYRDGDFAFIELLLDSKSVGDLLARMSFLRMIGVKDADLAEQLRAQKDQIEQTALGLKDAEREAESLEFMLKARQIEITLRIGERQQMLAGAQSDLLDMLDAEAARRNAEEARLLREILAGANSKGISVEPSSPVETALAYHGVPYLWGGTTPAGFDCSGLMLYVFRQHGVELPHYSGSQFLMGERVVPADLKPGDVVFFGNPIHHVGMYIGGGYFIHAPRTGDFVKVSPLADRLDYAGARRYPWKPRTAPVAGMDQLSPYATNLSGLGLVRQP